jgi:hypothetical protein
MVCTSCGAPVDTGSMIQNLGELLPVEPPWEVQLLSFNSANSGIHWWWQSVLWNAIFTHLQCNCTHYSQCVKVKGLSSHSRWLKILRSSIWILLSYVVYCQWLWDLVYCLFPAIRAAATAFKREERSRLLLYQGVKRRKDTGEQADQIRLKRTNKVVIIVHFSHLVFGSSLACKKCFHIAQWNQVLLLLVNLSPVVIKVKWRKLDMLAL